MHMVWEKGLLRLMKRLKEGPEAIDTSSDKYQVYGLNPFQCFYHIFNIQCVSRIWTLNVKHAYGGLVLGRLEPIFAIAPVASKNDACFKSDPKIIILIHQSQSVTNSVVTRVATSRL